MIIRVVWFAYDLFRAQYGSIMIVSPGCRIRSDPTDLANPWGSLELVKELFTKVFLQKSLGLKKEGVSLLLGKMFPRN